MPPSATLLEPASLEALNRPVETALGLPRHAYKDVASLALEREFVIDANWVFVDVVGCLPNPSDLMPMDLVGRPVVVVRQYDGSVRALHNICRHREVILVDKVQSQRPTMTCPCHAWSYGLDDRLLKTPHFSGDGNHETGAIGRKCLNLKAIRCETWYDLIIVNLSGDAMPLFEHMRPIEQRYCDFDFSEMRLGAVQDFALTANWKLLIKNFVEGSHLLWTPPFLNAIPSMANHYTTIDEPIAGRGSDLYERDKARNDGLPTFSGLSEHWQVRAEYPSPLPNTLMGVHVDHITVWGIYPDGVGRSTGRVYFFYAGDAALTAEFAPERAMVESNLRGINLEDVGVVDSMQRGRASPGYAVAHLSPYHKSCEHSFEKRIANAVGAGLGIV